MRRVGLLVVAVGALVLGVILVAPRLVDTAERVDPYSSMVTAHLDVISEPDVVRPDARFTRTIYQQTELDGVDPALDACAGPVSVDLGDDRPVLVAEHDYCGGLAWMPKLKSDEVVALKGPGVEPGLYTVAEIKRVPRYTSEVKDLPDTAVVLQTCISRTTMVLVGLQLDVPDEI